MNQNEILKALDCCADFMCGECPYRKYENKEYPFKCIHKLMVDLKELKNKKKKKGELNA